jgi:ABC-type transporter MlaC component
LPPEQRQALRSRWQHFQSLPPNERAIVRENFHRFQQLPPARRQMLREQWRNATPAQRQQMVQHAREHLKQSAPPHAAAPHGPPPHH